MYWNGMLIRKDRASKVYQEMCGEVFGKNTVHIERGVMTLHKVVNNGDINGVCDTFDHDNY